MSCWTIEILQIVSLLLAFNWKLNCLSEFDCNGVPGLLAIM